MTHSIRSIVCSVCDTAFAYAYTGGRNRRMCDDPACKRARKASNKRTERSANTVRPDGYRLADYPHTIPATLPKAELDALVILTTDRYLRRKLRVQPEGVADPDSDTADSEDNAPEAQLYEAGHGMIMDDYRERDTVPLRLIEPVQRGAVKFWFRQAGFPMAGLRVDVTRGSYPVTRVRGRLDDDAYTGTVPRRLTRHWCSRTALSPLEPFVSPFLCTSEGRTAA